MFRRVSAQELEQRYKLKHLLLDFFDSMKAKMYENLEEKGFSWKNCDVDYLVTELVKHVNDKDWVDVANFAFMLDDRHKDGKAT